MKLLTKRHTMKVILSILKQTKLKVTKCEVVIFANSLIQSISRLLVWTNVRVENVQVVEQVTRYFAFINLFNSIYCCLDWFWVQFLVYSIMVSIV